ncbi:GAD-like domain-containing protein [Pseudomonas viridiflava]|uniref:GAD-like domain-containing protein n=1 Tax=Pseudomonas viridiflava TaxID=33069 RepID=UPI0020BF13EF|nr:GAD-like domain-containing protein [Pseudomonas viridiflava]
MKDPDFEAFIAGAGEAAVRRDVPHEQISKYSSILPDALLGYWKEEGWCGYADGLFWTVNPDDYKHLLDMWLAGTEIEGLDNYHVIARNAFGELYAWGEKYNRKIVVSCCTGAIIALKNQLQKPNKNPGLAIQTFFAMFEKEAYDLESDEGQFLFEQALKKLGPLNESEVYGFQPPLFLGGAPCLENMVKCDLDVHLTILRQLKR